MNNYERLRAASAASRRWKPNKMIGDFEGLSLRDLCAEYDATDMGPAQDARFTEIGEYWIEGITDLYPCTGKEMDADSSINDGYYQSLEVAVANGAAPPLVISECDGVPTLHDGWHRAALALANDMKTLTVYLHIVQTLERGAPVHALPDRALQ